MGVTKPRKKNKKKLSKQKANYRQPKFSEQPPEVIDKINEINISSYCLFEEILELKQIGGLEIPKIKNAIEYLHKIFREEKVECIYDAAYEQAPEAIELLVDTRKKAIKKIAQTDFQDKLPFLMYISKYKLQRERYWEKTSDELDLKIELKQLKGVNRDSIKRNMELEDKLEKAEREIDSLKFDLSQIG